MYNTPDIIYTDRPLDAQIDMNKLQRIFKTEGYAYRYMAYITYKYEKAINKGKAYITITYEYVKHTRKVKPVIQISDTDSQVELTRIVNTHAFAHRRRRKAQ